MSFDRNAFGHKLSALRNEAGLSQHAVSQSLNVSDKAVSKWENGAASPSLESLAKISQLYHISLDELFEAAEVTDKRIVRIVLTGGPCAGKSTAISWIMEDMQNKGWKVIFVPEVPTELINAGLTPVSCGSMAAFNQCVFNMQLNKEDRYLAYAKSIPAKNILIVHDRGLMDCKAYLSSSQFNALLKAANLTEIQARDRYDAVYHLVTAAKGARAYYGSANNKARTETAEEAIALDDKTAKAWAGHPHLHILDNSTGFEEKMQRLLVAISRITGGPTSSQTLRRFLIEMPDLKVLERAENCTKVEVLQTYLKGDEHHSVRVRQRGSNGDYLYAKTVKEKDSDDRHDRGILYEEQLTESQYLTELMNADPDLAPIREDRYYLFFEDTYVQVDILPFWKNKALLEFPSSSIEADISIPKPFKVIEDVTDNPRYWNRNLARSLAQDS